MEEFKKCPYCAEEINKDALICKYCGSKLNEESEIQKTESLEHVEVKTKEDLEIQGAVDTSLENKDKPQESEISQVTTLETKTCPYCAENINKEAVKCRYCEMSLVEEGISDIKDSVKVEDKKDFQIKENVKASKGNNKAKEETPEDKTIKSKIIGVLGSVILGIVIFLGILYYKEVEKENMFEEKSVELINEILKENGYSDIYCKEVTIEKELEKVTIEEGLWDSIYSATGYLSDDQKIKLSIKTSRKIDLSNIDLEKKEYNIKVEILQGEDGYNTIKIFPIEVRIVQNGIFPTCPNIILKDMVDSYINTPTWESGIGNNGKSFVNVKGGILYDNKKVELGLQFVIVDKNTGTFKYQALELNGLAQNNVLATSLMKNMCKEAKSNQRIAKRKARSKLYKKRREEEKARVEYKQEVRKEVKESVKVEKKEDIIVEAEDDIKVENKKEVKVEKSEEDILLKLFPDGPEGTLVYPNEFIKYPEYQDKNCSSIKECSKFAKLAFNGEDYSDAIKFYKKGCILEDIKSCDNYQKVCRYSSEKLCLDSPVKDIVKKYEDFCKAGKNKYCLEMLRVATSNGIDYSDDLKKYVKYAKNLYKKGNVESTYFISLMYIDNGDMKNSIKFLDQACNGKNYQSCYILGKIYSNSQKWGNLSKSKKDFILSAKYYEKSCNLGSIEGCKNALDVYRYSIPKTDDTKDFLLKKANTLSYKACSLGGGIECLKNIKSIGSTEEQLMASYACSMSIKYPSRILNSKKICDLLQPYLKCSSGIESACSSFDAKSLCFTGKQSKCRKYIKSLNDTCGLGSEKSCNILNIINKYVKVK